MPAPRLVGGQPQGRQAAEGLLAELPDGAGLISSAAHGAFDDH